jgi:hypothetical protein
VIRASAELSADQSASPRAECVSWWLALAQRASVGDISRRVSLDFQVSAVRSIRLGALIERDPSIAGFNIGVNCGAAAAQTVVTGRPNVIETVTFAGRARFSIQHDGVCRMNPELARSVAQLAWSVAKSAKIRH